MTESAEPSDPDPVAPAHHTHRRRPRGKALAAIIASGVVAIAGAVTAVVVITSGPSYPHPWCGPVLAQLHAHENQDVFDANMTALESQGAPVANLIADGDTAVQDENAANNSGLVSAFGYLADGLNAMGRVQTDLQAINRACGQPASAYKNDIF
jgi:hypothetical protein